MNPVICSLHKLNAKFNFSDKEVHIENYDVVQIYFESWLSSNTFFTLLRAQSDSLLAAFVRYSS